jgi:predicted nucleic-acid-binding Zn-ribbon protein
MAVKIARCCKCRPTFRAQPSPRVLTLVRVTLHPRLYFLLARACALFRRELQCPKCRNASVHPERIFASSSLPRNINFSSRRYCRLLIFYLSPQRDMKYSTSRTARGAIRVNGTTIRFGRLMNRAVQRMHFRCTILVGVGKYLVNYTTCLSVLLSNWENKQTIPIDRTTNLVATHQLCEFTNFLTQEISKEREFEVTNIKKV